MTDAERIEHLEKVCIQLANLTANVAARCWEALGTTIAKEINQECLGIIEELQR